MEIRVTASHCPNGSILLYVNGVEVYYIVESDVSPGLYYAGAPDGDPINTEAQPLFWVMGDLLTRALDGRLLEKQDA